MFCVRLPAEEARVSVPVAWPPAVGANFTVTVAEASEAISSVGHSTLKGLSSPRPLAVRVKGFLPMLSTLMVALLSLPVARMGKVRAVGATFTA